MKRIKNAIPLSLAILIACFLLVASQTSRQTKPTSIGEGSYKVGGILSDNASHIYFNEIIEEINEEPKFRKSFGFLREVTIIMDSNPIRTAREVCDKIIKQGVYAMVVSHPMSGDLSPAAVSYTSGFYHIPVIGISTRDSAFSDKNIHVSFLRTVPPYSHQADVWVELLNQFKYTQVVFIYSSDTDGRALLGRFRNNAQNHEDDKDIKEELAIEFEPGLDDFVGKLKEMREASSRVILLYADKRDSGRILHDAFYFNMTGENYVWIVTEQALTAEYVPVGSIGIRLVNSSNENAHISDSLHVLAKAMQRLRQDKNATHPPKDCDDSGNTWSTGIKLFGYIREQVLEDGLTGKVAFDDHGDRMNAEYDVINIQDVEEAGIMIKKEVVVGHYNHHKPTSYHPVPSDETEGEKKKRMMKLRVNESAIIWPGSTRIKPQGYMIPTHLKVLTIIEKPFVHANKIEVKSQCVPPMMLCPWYNTTSADTILYCCSGYCIDLMEKLAKKINFTYELALSPDGEFGSLEYNKMIAKKEWTGLIGELIRPTNGGDMIVAPLTINPERAQVIEFSKPFKYQGITILEKKQPRLSTLVSFLQPFRNTLWILVLVSVHVVAIALYLLDRFSPFGRYKMPNMDGTEEDALNLSSAVWFSWGVLLNSGIGEGTPRSFSARVLGMVWAGFAMIIVASYTANLAAFLVLDRPQTSLTGINDARLRNPMENFTYATVKGSAVDMYFRRQVELSNMYRTMEGNNYHTAEEAIQAVKDGTLKAFIWDSSRLEYEAAQECELITAGELFGRSGYGIGLRKGSPWADKITLAILEFHESGYMEDLDNKWILQDQDEKCDTDDRAPATLGLKNMAGVFILVAGGVILGIGLIIIEILYKKQQIRKQKRFEIARHAADKWRGAVQKRKDLRQAVMMQRRMKSNGVSDPQGPNFNVESQSSFEGGPSASGIGLAGRPGSSMALRTLSDAPMMADVDLPADVPPPPAPPSSKRPMSLPLEVPPAPTPLSVRWSNDLRQRHVAITEDMLPPPPPPPQSSERHASAFKSYGVDPPDLVV